MAILIGTTGDDIFTGGADPDTASGGVGADVISGAGGDDILFSDVAQPYFTRNTYVTQADTGGTVDTLAGGDGDDIISAGYGDSVDGGADDYQGDNLIVSFLGASSGVNADFRQSTLVIGGGTITGIEGLIWVQGSNFDDYINLGVYHNYNPNTQAYGMGGNDTLITGYYTAEMYGGDGDDVVDGRNGQYLRILDGGGGDDVLYTPATSAEAFGGDGDDTIHARSSTHGGAGNDLIIMEQSSYPAWLMGDEGDDQIQAIGAVNYGAGGAGADILTGDFYNDVLYSGAGPGVGVLKPDDMGLEHDQLFGEDGDDTLSAGFGDDVDGGNGTDSLRLSLGGSASGFTFSTAGLVSGQPIVLGGGAITNVETLEHLRGSEFADNLTLATQAALMTVDGGAGDDLITASNSSVAVFGGAGDDRFVSGKAGDTFDGGEGSDTIDYSGYATAVTASLATGSGAGGDTFTNVENIVGGGGGDTLAGDRNDNILDGGAGIDTISYAAAAGGVTIDIQAANAQQTGGAGKDVLLGFENVIGSDFGDVLGGNALANLLTGGAGNDVLIGRGGADVLDGGAGSDTANYAGAAAGINANLAALLVSNDGDGASDTLSGIEHIIGSVFADTMLGDAGANILQGGQGADTLTGGTGADTFKYAAASDSTLSAGDLVTDFQTGVDRIDLTGLQATLIGLTYVPGGTTLSALTAGGALEIDVAGEVKISDVLAGALTSFALTGGPNGETLRGGAGADTLKGGGGGDALFGGTGADTFAYASATDSTNANLDIIHDFQTGVDHIDLSAMAPSNISIQRYNGGAIINGGAASGAFQIGSINVVNGSDLAGIGTGGVYLIGEDVAATLIGSANPDSIVGGASDDIIIGGASGDALFGRGGANTFAYVSATDSNNANLDIIHDFKTGVDRLDLSAMGVSNVSILHYGGGTFVNGGTAGGAFQIGSITDISGSDIVGLGTGGVYLVGENVAATLIGSANADTVMGGSANDIIVGGGAADALFGGAGHDTFRFVAKSDSAVAAPDIIHDFQTGVDKIDLTALHTHGANDHYSVVSDATTSYLFVQLAGNTGNDMLILFTNPGVQAGDVLW